MAGPKIKPLPMPSLVFILCAILDTVIAADLFANMPGVKRALKAAQAALREAGVCPHPS